MEIKVYSVKLKVGEKIYFVYDNPKYQIIYVAYISRIAIGKTTNFMYNFESAKLVHMNKLLVTLDEKKYKKKNDIDFGFFYDHNIDSGIPNGDIRIFTSKDKCTKYIKEVKNK